MKRMPFEPQSEHYDEQINRKRYILLKSFQLVMLFFIAFLLESVAITELIFIEDSLPEFTGLHKVQNRLLVILFFLLLLVTIGKKYIYLFKIDFLKTKESYIWITTTIIAIYIMMQIISGFNNLGYFRLFPLDFISYIQLLMIVVILVPIQEEFLYRGLLLLIPNQKFKYIMLLVSSIIFGLIHNQPFYFFWMGLGLGILAIRFNNILIPIITHSLWNFTASFFDF
jgi:uncharacterized protein